MRKDPLKEVFKKVCKGQLYEDEQLEAFLSLQTDEYLRKRIAALVTDIINANRKQLEEYVAREVELSVRRIMSEKQRVFAINKPTTKWQF